MLLLRGVEVAEVDWLLLNDLRVINTLKLLGFHNKFRLAIFLSLFDNL